MDANNKKKAFDKAFKILTFLFTAVFGGVVIFLLLYLLFKGVGKMLSLNLGETFAIGGNTVIYLALVCVFVLPISMFLAIYLVFYSRKNLFLDVIRASIELLSSIPSIIFGLFGMLVFVNFFSLGFCLLAGAGTMTMMLFPILIQSFENVLLSQGDSLLLASIALGSTRAEGIFKIVIREKLPFLLSALSLSLARAAGETAALVFTIGSASSLARTLFSSSRVLSTNIYLMVNEGKGLDDIFASALLLIVLVLSLDMVCKFLTRKSQF